jgi:hypothetical protein
MLSEFAVAPAERQRRVEFSNYTDSNYTDKENNSEAPFTWLRSSASNLSVLNDELKNLHQNPDGYWYAMGNRLQTILSQRLYRTGGYSSFTAYCSRGLGYSRQHVYKLIKVANFIDELWMRAETPEQRKIVHRLFSLGFTKLYVLNSLRTETLEKLLKDGITVSEGNGSAVYSQPLEAVTISQLKRSLETRTTCSSVTPISQAKSRSLISLLEIQARTLTRYIGQWRRDTGIFDPAEQLQTIEQYALSILEGVEALSGRIGLRPDPIENSDLLVNQS